MNTYRTSTGLKTKVKTQITSGRIVSHEIIWSCIVLGQNQSIPSSKTWVAGSQLYHPQGSSVYSWWTNFVWRVVIIVRPSPLYQLIKRFDDTLWILFHKCTRFVGLTQEPDWLLRPILPVEACCWLLLLAGCGRLWCFLSSASASSSSWTRGNLITSHLVSILYVTLSKIYLFFILFSKRVSEAKQIYQS